MASRVFVIIATADVDLSSVEYVERKTIISSNIACFGNEKVPYSDGYFGKVKIHRASMG